MLSEKRTGRVTGSRAGAILGLNPWQTKDDVMRLMVREYHGLAPEFKGNIATAYGNMMEPEAIFDFELENNLRVEHAGFFEYEDWIGATPDGLVGNDAVIEVKSPYGLRGDPNPKFKTADDQPHYYAQMQLEMLATKRSKCYFWQWTPFGSKLEIVKFNQKWVDENLPKLKEFHDEFLKEIHNKKHLEDKQVVIKDKKLLDLCATYDECVNFIKELEKQKKEMLNLIVEFTGERNCKIGDKTHSKVEKKGNISYSKVVKDHLKDLDLEPYRGKPSSYWVLK